MNYFVTAIGTDCGKTLTSAIICKALGADYWKPIQAGFPRDAQTVQTLSPQTKIHPEAFVLNTPASPHAAAKIDKIQIQLSNIKVPTTTNDLVIEGAGGCLVPVNNTEFIIDLCGLIPCKIIVVANLYLGSINHTLLTINLLKQRGYPVKGIIFNGTPNPDSEEIILKHSAYFPLLHIHPEKEVNTKVIEHYADQLKKQWK